MLGTSVSVNQSRGKVRVRPLLTPTILIGAFALVTAFYRTISFESINPTIALQQ